MSIFKSNDIRGIFPKELEREKVYRIGYSLPSLLNSENILIGRDSRLSSPEIFEILSSGITDAGADVTDIGLCDTPAVYFSTMHYRIRGSVMITASHNPPEYNGFKISRKNAVPVSYTTGLNKLEKMIERQQPAVKRKGSIRFLNIRRDYLNHLQSFKKGIKELKVVIDCSDGAAGAYIHDLINDLNGEFITIFAKPDGNFPNHGPDPLSEKNRSALKGLVLKEKANLGVLFDGDGDRAIIIDEKGEFVSPDIITALLSIHFFKHFPEKTGIHKTVLYDIRSSKSIAEYITGLGGHTLACPTGHARIKKLLREKQGVLAGELAGHYYFRDNFYTDSGFIAFLLILSVLSIEKKKVSELVAEINPYYFSGEINFALPDSKRIIEGLGHSYAGGVKNYLDGLRIDFPEWWFIVRPSNAEPILRLVVEAETEQLLKERTEELCSRIKELA